MRRSNKILLRKLTIGLTLVLMGTLMMATPKQGKAGTKQASKRKGNAPAKHQQASRQGGASQSRSTTESTRKPRARKAGSYSG